MELEGGPLWQSSGGQQDEEWLQDHAHADGGDGAGTSREGTDERGKGGSGAGVAQGERGNHDDTGEAGTSDGDEGGGDGDGDGSKGKDGGKSGPQPIGRGVKALIAGMVADAERANLLPTGKRQRRAPTHLASEYIKGADVDHVVDGSKKALEVLAAVGEEEEGHRKRRRRSGSHVDEEESEEEKNTYGVEITDAVALDPSHVEVEVVYNNRVYRGVLERSALPLGVGVAVPVTQEELDAASTMGTAAKEHKEHKDKPAVNPLHPKGVNPTNLCALCNTPLAIPPVADLSVSAAGYMAKTMISCNWTARCHLTCALWCPEVEEVEAFPGHYLSLGSAVRRGRALRCRKCKERGATVGCFHRGCQSVYHLNCAQEVGCRLIEENRHMWCPQHAALAHVGEEYDS